MFLFARAQVWPKPPLCASWVRQRRQDLERVAFFNTRASEPLPAQISPRLRTYPGTVLRNAPSVQRLFSVQVLQARTSAPRRTKAIACTRTLPPRSNNTPPPFNRLHRTVLRYTLLSPFSLSEFTSSADARAPRSPQRTPYFYTFPQVPPPHTHPSLPPANPLKP